MKKIAALLLALLLALGAPTPVDAGEPPGSEEVRVIEIVVEAGYHPDRIVVREGEAVRLRFLRKEWDSCTLEVVFDTLGIRRQLPTGEPVEIDLGTPAAGEIPFHCWMNMVHGVIVVEPSA